MILEKFLEKILMAPLKRMIHLKTITCYNYLDRPLKVPSGLNMLDTDGKYHNKYILTSKTTILLRTSNIEFKLVLVLASIIHKFS